MSATIVRLPKARRSARNLAGITRAWNEMTPMQLVGFMADEMISWLASKRMYAEAAKYEADPRVQAWRRGVRDEHGFDWGDGRIRSSLIDWPGERSDTHNRR